MSSTSGASDSTPALSAAVPSVANPTPNPQPATPLPTDKDLEELAIFRIVEEAKKRILSLLKWGGGLIIAIAAILGIRFYTDYHTALKDMKDGLDTKVSDEVTKAVAKKTENFDNFTNQMIESVAKVKVASIGIQADIIKLQESSSQIRKKLDEVSVGLEKDTRDFEVKKALFCVTLGSVDEAQAKAQQGTSVTFKIDISGSIGPIRDQGKHASVVGYALAYLVRAAVQKRYNKVFDASAEYVYVNAQKLGGTPINFETGTSLEDALLVMKTVGVVPLSSWPDGKERQEGPLEPKYRVRQYQFTDKHKEWGDFAKFAKGALSEGQPILCSVLVTEAFSKPDANGRVSLPPRKLEQHANFCVVVVGLDETDKTVRFANSWGRNWGKEGFGYMSFTDFDRILHGYGTIREIEEVSSP